MGCRLLFFAAISVWVQLLSGVRTIMAVTPDPTADAVYGQLGSFATALENNGGRSADSLLSAGGLSPALDVGGVLFIADRGNGRVLRYPKGSTTADRVWGVPNMGDFTTAGSLFTPEDVAVDSFGGVYVADFANDRVLYFTSTTTNGTTYAREYRRGCGGCSPFSVPAAVDVSPDGLFVADYFNHRVLFFPGGSTTPARVYGQIDFTSGSANMGLGFARADTLSGPSGVTAVPAGLYVSEYSNNRVLFFPGNSTTASRVYGQMGNFSSSTPNKGGVSADSLFQPLRVAVDELGGIFISDTGNHRVLYFPPDITTASLVYGQLNFYEVAPSLVVSASSLRGPYGLAFGEDGLYVGSGNNRALHYNSPTSSVTSGEVSSSAITAFSTGVPSSSSSSYTSSSVFSSTSTLSSSGPVAPVTSTTGNNDESTALPIILGVGGAILVVLLVLVSLALVLRRRSSKELPGHAISQHEKNGAAKLPPVGGNYHNLPRGQAEPGEGTQYHNLPSLKVDAGHYHNVETISTTNLSGTGKHVKLTEVVSAEDYGHLDEIDPKE